MPEKSFEDILRDLKNKNYNPIYFLQGDEPYFIDKVSDFIETHVLDEMGKEFNQTVIYGRETEPLSLLSIVKRYPMMSDYSVVIIKEAQDMKYFSRPIKEKEEPVKAEKVKVVADSLLHYIQHPLKSTVLVFCYKYKTLDKRSKLYKELDKHAVIFEGKKLYDNKIPEWVNNYLDKKGYKIKPQATQLIAEYLGNDLSRVANECDKLLLNIPKGQEIDVLNIEEHIGISKEFNVFELHTAIAKKQKLKAFRIAGYFKANPKNNPLVVTLGSLYTFFSKVLIYHSLNDKSRSNAAVALGVNPFFIQEYETAAGNYPLPKTIAVIGLLRQYDLKSKGVDNISAGEGELLRELLYKILH